MTFCVQCGPNVRVDEDGCCVHCGVTAIGPYADELRRAAAPELLEALKALVDRCECYGRERGEHSILCNCARAAIAKAEGR